MPTVVSIDGRVIVNVATPFVRASDALLPVMDVAETIAASRIALEARVPARAPEESVTVKVIVANSPVE